MLVYVSIYVCIYFYVYVCVFMHIYNIHTDILFICIYMFVYIYIYILYIYIVLNKTERKIYFILLFHFRVNALRSILVPLCLFIRHLFSQFTLRPC